jgi:plastocyanin
VTASKVDQQTGTRAVVLDEAGDNSNGRREPARPDLVKEVHLRIPLTIAIPVAAVVFLGIVALLFALFLLNLPKEHAPAVALALSINILAATTYAASRPKITGFTAIQLAILVIYPVLLAEILVNLGVGEPAEAVAGADHAAPAAAAAEPEAVELSAADLEFSTDELTLPADTETTITLDNQDTFPHNLSIYENDTLNEDFFVGSNVEAGATIDYEIPSLATGAYYFRCDLHPSMEGRVTVE